MKDYPEDSKSTSHLDGLGCFWILVGLAIVLNFNMILDVIQSIIKTH